MDQDRTRGQALNSTSVLNSVGRVNLLVLGGGYTGRRLAYAAAQRGVTGALSHRTPAESPPPTAPPGWQTVVFNPETGSLPRESELAAITHVVSTIPPGPDGHDPVLTHLLTSLRQLPLQWLGYLSTTGVYGDMGGQWAQEDTPCRPQAKRSQARRACEEGWLGSGLPVQIFRLPAIYGPGRNPLGDLRAGRARLVHKHGQVFCRVHVDDICGALLHCMATPAERRPLIVNVSDNGPCPSSEQLGFAAHLLDCKLPDVQPFEAIATTMGSMARSFWQENRRVSNQRLCGELGYDLRYPTYREGLRASLLEEAAAGRPAGRSPAQSPEGPGSAT